MVGAEAGNRHLPEQATAGDLKRRNIAPVAARDVQDAAVGRDVQVLRVVQSACLLDDRLSDHLLRVLLGRRLRAVGKDVDVADHPRRSPSSIDTVPPSAFATNITSRLRSLIALRPRVPALPHREHHLAGEHVEARIVVGEVRAHARDDQVVQGMTSAFWPNAPEA